MSFLLQLRELDKNNQQLISALKGTLLADVGLTIIEAKHCLEHSMPVILAKAKTKTKLKRGYDALRRLNLNVAVLDPQEQVQDMSDIALLAEEIELASRKDQAASESDTATTQAVENTDSEKKEIDDISFLEEKDLDKTIEAETTTVPEVVESNEILTTLSSQLKDAVNNKPERKPGLTWEQIKNLEKKTTKVKKDNPLIKIYRKLSKIDLGSDTLWYSLFASIFLLAVNSYNLAQNAEYLESNAAKNTNQESSIDNLEHKLTGESIDASAKISATVIIRNKLAKEVKVSINMDKPPELSAEELVLGNAPQPWVKEITFATKVLSGHGNYSANTHARIIVNHLGTDIIKIGIAKITGNFTERVASGKVNICLECDKPNDKFSIKRRDDGEFALQLNTEFTVKAN